MKPALNGIAVTHWVSCRLVDYSVLITPCIICKNGPAVVHFQDFVRIWIYRYDMCYIRLFDVVILLTSIICCYTRQV
jgi:hypothetical protein